jgi:ATP-dependent Zn protease
MLPSSGAAERAAREVEEMVKREEKVVVELLAANRAALEQIANQLMKHETIDGTTIQTLVRSGG